MRRCVGGGGAGCAAPPVPLPAAPAHGCRGLVGGGSRPEAHGAAGAPPSHFAHAMSTSVTAEPVPSSQPLRLRGPGVGRNPPHRKRGPRLGPCAPCSVSAPGPPGCRLHRPASDPVRVLRPAAAPCRAAAARALSRTSSGRADAAWRRRARRPVLPPPTRNPAAAPAPRPVAGARTGLCSRDPEGGWLAGRPAGAARAARCGVVTPSGGTAPGRAPRHPAGGPPAVPRTGCAAVRGRAGPRPLPRWRRSSPPAPLR